MIKVSVVIVCMNNLKRLIPCLSSIYKYTHIDMEIIVVAYQFTQSNIDLLKKKYPKLVIIESSEIRGFSENNNLALRISSGKYCFILNDDTELQMPVIDGLVETFEKLPPEAVVLSPIIKNVDGSIQFWGRPEISIKEHLLFLFRLWMEKRVRNKYTYQTGVFQTYNLSGAAFLIRRDVFEKIGFFNEYYFFCPEDIAVSTLLNKLGYHCYVDSNISIVHFEGNSGNKHISTIKEATDPAGIKGYLYFYGGNNRLRQIILIVCSFLSISLQMIKTLLLCNDKERKTILMKAYSNSLYALFHKGTPKEMFIKFKK